MAYMCPIDRQCEHTDCPRFSTHRVWIDYSTTGTFCTQHAEELVARVNAEREESRKRVIERAQ